VHPKVVGVAPDGRPYRADDPRLLTWVSIALTSSVLEGHRRWSPDVLTREEEDRFVAEQSRIGALLHPEVDLRALRDDRDRQLAFRRGELDAEMPLLKEGFLPLDVAQLEAVLHGFLPELGVNDQGREALTFLRRPPIPLVARPGYQSLLRGAIGSLSPELRHALELDRAARSADRLMAQADLTLRAMRFATGTSPTMHAARARTQATSGAKA
jgi:uncharacterized protein (DUF2236 family)